MTSGSRGPAESQVVMVTSRRLDRSGEAAAHVCRLAEALACQGLGVVLLYPETGGPAPAVEGVRGLGVPVGPSRLAAPLRYAAQVWRRLPALVAAAGSRATIYAEYGFPLTAPLLAARRARTPCVLGVEDRPRAAGFPGVRRLLYPLVLGHFVLCCRLADRVVAATTEAARAVHRLAGGPIGRVVVVPQGGEAGAWGPEQAGDAAGRLAGILPSLHGRVLALVTDNWFNYSGDCLRSNYFLYGPLLESLRPDIGRVRFYGRLRPGQAAAWPVVPLQPGWEFSLEGPPHGLIFRLLRTPLAFLRFLVGLRRADLVLLKFFSVNAVVAYAAARLLGRPVVLQVVGDPAEALRARVGGWRGTVLRPAAALLYRLTRGMGRKADLLWLVSSHLAARYASGPSKTVVANESRVEPGWLWRRPPGGCGAPARLFFLGRLERVKGPDLALEVLRLLRDRGIDCTLDLAGQGSLARRLRRWAESYGLSSRVNFLGWVAFGPDLWACLRSADILVLPSRTEGMPLVVLEAMASSLPVVASDVGATAEALGGCAGLVVPPENPGAVANCIVRLIADRELYDRLAQAGPDLAQRFTAAQEVCRVAAQIRALLSRDRARSGR